MIRYRIVSIRKTSDACPAQWSGKTREGEAVYIRYRFGYFRATVGGMTVFETEYGDPMSGVMDDRVMRTLTQRVFNWTKCTVEAEPDGDTLLL